MSAVKYYVTLAGILVFVGVVGTGQWWIIGVLAVLVPLGLVAGYYLTGRGESQGDEESNEQ